MTNDSWRRQVHLIRCIQKQHKFLLGRSPVKPERLRYGLGVMLLLSKGHSAVGGDLTPLDLWPSYYRKAQRFGRPLGHARTLRNGTKVRRSRAVTRSSSTPSSGRRGFGSEERGASQERADF